MAGAPSKAALGHLRVLFDLGTIGHLTDAELLERFTARPGPAAELAFAAIVERHGPMVLATCRRVLRDPHDAEDAFQATFLVLAHKARSARPGQRLAGWLYGVAHRTAVCARNRTLRRRTRERSLAAGVRLVTQESDGFDDLRSVLDEELGHLPGRYREAVVLCELEGLGRAEAARRLGVPEGTLSSRLNRARRLLRDRLSRRGLGLGTAGLTSVLAGAATARTVPTTLVESTVKAAILVAAGPCATGVVSASVVALSEGVLRMMLFSKLKGAALAALALVLVAAGAGVLAQQAPGPDGNPDRLGQVERKLDRILEALGGKRPNPENPVNVPGTAEVEFVNARPSGETAPAAEEPVVVSGRSRRSAAQLAHPDRLADLERRLARVEQELAELKAAGRGASSATEKPVGLSGSDHSNRYRRAAEAKK